MLSDIKGKEQSTVLERESFTTNFVNNSDDQWINKQSSMSYQQVSTGVTTCKEDFFIKTKENTRVTTSHHFFTMKVIT